MVRGNGEGLIAGLSCPAKIADSRDKQKQKLFVDWLIDV